MTDETPEEYLELNEKGKEHFEDVFDREKIPVHNIQPIDQRVTYYNGSGEKVQERELVIRGAYGELTEEEKESLREHLKKERGYPDEEMKKRLERKGAGVLISTKFVGKIVSEDPESYIR